MSTPLLDFKLGVNYLSEGKHETSSEFLTNSNTGTFIEFVSLLENVNISVVSVQIYTHGTEWNRFQNSVSKNYFTLKRLFFFARYFISHLTTTQEHENCFF